MLSITAPGVYDIPIDQYLADPCVEPSFSASIGKAIMQLSPKHAWMMHPKLGGGTTHATSAKSDFGSVVHELVLGNGSKFHVLHCADFRKKAHRDMRDASIAAGFVPIKIEDFERAEAAAKSIRAQVPDVFEEGDAEQTFIWRDEEAWCRARPDWLVRSAHMVFDLKISAVNVSPLENTLNRHIFSMWYDFTVAHYADGYRALFGEELEYRFLFVEDHPPFSIRPFRLSGQGLEMGERKLRAARTRWKKCIATNRWPGIPLSLDYADPEPWHASGWLTYSDSGLSEREVETAIEMHAPMEDA